MTKKLWQEESDHIPLWLLPLAACVVLPLLLLVVGVAAIGELLATFYGDKPPLTTGESNE